MNPLVGIAVLVVAIILHEIAHGAVAAALGDPTAKQAGRLTLNPLPHLDILGSLLVPGIAFFSGSGILIGWAKPVPVNPNYFKNPMRDMLLVAIAGPAINFSLAIGASLMLRMILLSQIPITSIPLIVQILMLTININLILGLFNLLPIPPLDGSKILVYFLPPDFQSTYLRIEPFGFAIIFLLAYLNVLTPILAFLFTPIQQILLPG